MTNSQDSIVSGSDCNFVICVIKYDTSTILIYLALQSGIPFKADVTNYSIKDLDNPAEGYAR